jgi:hypothetical protein
MTCPLCKRENPPGSLRCGCGLDFATGVRDREGVTPKSLPANAGCISAALALFSQGSLLRRCADTHCPFCPSSSRLPLQPVAEVPRAARRNTGRALRNCHTSRHGLRRHGVACFVPALVRGPASNRAPRLAFDPVALATKPTPLLPQAVGPRGDSSGSSRNRTGPALAGDSSNRGGPSRRLRRFYPGTDHGNRFRSLIAELRKSGHRP